MGQVNLHKGSLFTSPAAVIVHGVNCRGRFASGIAGQVAHRHPEVKRAYLRKHASDGWKLGDVQGVCIGDGRYIFNCATQDAYGHDGGPYASVDAIGECLEKVAGACLRMGHPFLAMPEVGCGLGGLAWADVEPVVLVVAEELGIDIDVYHL